MKVKIISEQSSEKLEQTVNDFINGNPDAEIINVDVKSLSNHEYWLNNNPVTIAQSWVEYICVITYREPEQKKFCSDTCKEVYKAGKLLNKTAFCDNCEAEIESEIAK